MLKAISLNDLIISCIQNHLVSQLALARTQSPVLHMRETDKHVKFIVGPQGLGCRSVHVNTLGGNMHLHKYTIETFENDPFIEHARGWQTV